MKKDVAEIDREGCLRLVEETVRQAIADIETGVRLIPMYKEKILEIERGIIIGDSFDLYEMETNLKRNRDLLRETIYNYISVVRFFDSEWFEFILGSVTSLETVNQARKHVKELTGKLPE